MLHITLRLPITLPVGQSNTKVEDAIIGQAVKWEAEHVVVKIEVSGKTDKTLQSALVSELAEEPMTIDRLTRTDKLLNPTRAKAEVLQAHISTPETVDHKNYKNLNPLRSSPV